MFVVIHDDKPIYQLSIVGGEKHIKEYFLIHASLDTVDLVIKNKRDYFVGQIKSDDIVLYAYVNAISKPAVYPDIRFLLVLGQKKEIEKSLEKNIKEFFGRTNEALAQAFLNPLYKPKDYVKSVLFEQRVKAALKDCLRQVFDKRK